MSEMAVLAQHLAKTYWRGRPGAAALRQPVRALQGASLAVQRGSCLALLGPSGGGKSTLVRCIAGWEHADSGSLAVDGGVQLIVQEPGRSLNPHMRVREIVEEPLRIAGVDAAPAAAMLDAVGLAPPLAERRPDALSGGERARAALARALVARPGVVILDETLSHMDLPLQGQLANLVLQLQRSLRLTCIVVTHDPRLAAWMADEVALMRDGRVAGQGPPSLLEEMRPA